MLSLQALIQTLLTFVWANLQDVARTTGNALLLLYNVIAGGGSFVFQPGGTATGNVYTTWASLYAALPAASAAGLRPPSTIQVDTSYGAAAIPAGAYNLSNATLVPAEPAMVLTLDVGVTLAPGALTIAGGLFVHSLATASVMTAGTTGYPFVTIRQGSQLKCLAAGAFLEVPGGFSGGGFSRVARSSATVCIRASSRTTRGR